VGGPNSGRFPRKSIVQHRASGTYRADRHSNSTVATFPAKFRADALAIVRRLLAFADRSMKQAEKARGKGAAKSVSSAIKVLDDGDGVRAQPGRRRPLAATRQTRRASREAGEGRTDPRSRTHEGGLTVADDLSGLKATLAAANAAVLNSAALQNNEPVYTALKTLQAEVKKAATANTLTGF
jgi:hypothetical protein